MIITQKIENKRESIKMKKIDLCKKVNISTVTYWRFIKTGSLDFSKVIEILEVLSLKVLIYE